MPGAAWQVVSARGVASRGAVGQASIAPLPTPTSEATPYDLASLTKPLATAPLLALAEQEGLVDLAAPVGAYLRELAGSPHAGTSLLDLAAHRGGLPAWRPLYLEAADLGSFLRRIAREPPAVRRGETLYSDLGYILLGAVLERVFRAGLDRLFAERVARAAGLARLGFATGPDRFADAAATEVGNAYERAMAGEAGATHGWRDELLRGEVHDANAHALGGVAGHAGLFGTAAEVARLGRAMLEPERLGLGPRARSRLLDTVEPGSSRTVGWVTAAGSSAARGILAAAAPGHTGFTGTSIWLEPEREAVYVLLTNRVHPRVDARSFQPVRRGFHRIARGLPDAR